MNFNPLDFKVSIKQDLDPQYVNTSGDEMTGNLSVPSITLNGQDLISLISSCIPVGTIISSLSPTAPTGYLPLQGELFNISDYPNLYSLINGNGWNSLYNSGSGVPTGKFFLPDTKGAFLRGAGANTYYQWVNNAGNSLGGFQSDGIKSHAHTYTASTGSQSTQVGTANSRDNSSQTWKTGNEIYYPESPSVNSGMSETRPFNLSVCWYIKY